MARRYDPLLFPLALKKIREGCLIGEASMSVWGTPNGLRSVISQVGREHLREQYLEAKKEGEEIRHLELSDRKTIAWESEKEQANQKKAMSFLMWVSLVSNGALLSVADKDLFGFEGAALAWIKSLTDPKRRDILLESYAKAKKRGEEKRWRTIGSIRSEARVIADGVTQPSRIPRKYCELCGKSILRRRETRFTSPSGPKELARFCTDRCRRKWLGLESKAEQALIDILDYADQVNVSPGFASWLMSGRHIRACQLKNLIASRKSESPVVDRYQRSLYRPMVRKVSILPPLEWREILNLWENGEDLAVALRNFGFSVAQWLCMVERSEDNKGPKWILDEIEKSKKKREEKLDNGGKR